MQQELEEIDPREEENRRKLGRDGWRKVRKTILMALRMQNKDQLLGKAETNFKKFNYWDYQNYVIHPTSLFKFVWRVVLSFLLLYQLLIFPYRYAFNNYSSGFIVVDGVMDIVFLLDFLLNFFYAYVDKRQKLVNTFKPILLKYLSSTLLTDLTALFPYYFLDGNTMYILKILRYFRIGDMLSGITMFLDELFLKLKNNMNFALSITRIINFGILLALIGQVFGCLWYFIGDWNIRNYDEGWIWNFLSDKNGQRADQTTIYITSIYWVFTTLSTLGYGDYFPVTRNEYLFTMAIEFMGVFLFAYMMGNINSLIEKLDDDHDEYIENEFEVLDQWLMKIDRANPKRRLDQERVEKIRSSLKTYWEKDHLTVQNNDFLHQLPVELKGDLISHLFSGFLDRFQIFFKDLEVKFNQELVINLYPRKYQKGEDIILIDSGSKNLYFIVKGSVTIGSKDGISSYVELGEGSYFGDYLIFFRLRSSNCFRASSDLELMCIKKKKFLEICEMYPESAKLLKYRAFLRRKFIRKQKKAIEDLKAAIAQGEEREKKNKLIDQFTAGHVQLDSKTEELPPVKIPTLDTDDEDLVLEDFEEGPENGTKAENKVKQEELLKKSQQLSNKLDVLSDHINIIEGDFNKKLKSLKSHVDFLSHFEDYFKRKTAAN